MKKCLIITLAAMSCVHLGFAASSKGASLLNFLGRYQNRYQQLGAIDHADFGRALEKGERLAYDIQLYDQQLNAAKLPQFKPHTDNPKSYVDRLSDEQLDAFAKPE